MKLPTSGSALCSLACTGVLLKPHPSLSRVSNWSLLEVLHPLSAKKTAQLPKQQPETPEKLATERHRDTLNRPADHLAKYTI